MSHSWLAFRLASLLYPLPAPPEKRTKELKVLCLGLPRSGTESLREALRKLGYDDVSHGFWWLAEQSNTSPIYMKLALLRLHNQTPDAATLRREYFDRALSGCEATTDIPAAWFSEELLEAYPDAMVVLNRRKDVKAWKESFRGSVLPFMQSWQNWLNSWFDADLFWMMAVSYLLHDRVLFEGSFEANAERAYEEHYEKLEKALKKAGRPYLKWGVDDGWVPLCKFLNKPVPDGDFPNGNVAAEFGPKAAAVSVASNANARKNMLIVGGVAIAIASSFIYAGVFYYRV